ncbi:hypothetical protein [Tunturiibacter gelidiferens]|uniref:hypothetical protein n=1 Tax=Tunturiibacter gelidiferens TaxID=3069689 RepID=UPI003D9B5C08
MSSSVVVWSWVRLGSMTRTGWTWTGVAPGAMRGDVAADVFDGGEGLFEGLFGGRVDGGHLLLDVETVGG